MEVVKLKGSINNQLVSHTSNNSKNGVPSTTAKWISFCNHRNKKVVGGKHKVLVYHVNASAPDLEGLVLCNTLSNEIFYGSSLIENLVVCVPSTTVDCNLFSNHRSKKLVGGKHNVIVHYSYASAPYPEGLVLYNTLSNEIFCCVYTYILNP